MQLLKFELYKIFTQKIVWVSLIILLGMSYLSLHYPYSSSTERELYRDWEGPITEEKVQQAKRENASLMEKEDQRTKDEETVYADTEVMKVWMFQKIILAESIENNITNRLNELKSENITEAIMEVNMLEKMNVSDFSYNTGPSYTVGFVQFGSFIVTGVMLLIGLSPIYSNEYSSGVDNYILSAKKGRQPLVWAKVGASLIYTLFIVLAWATFSFIVNYLQHGNDGWRSPIQLLTVLSKQMYKESPYAFEALEYHVIQLGIHLLGAFAFALLILLISSICKNSLTTFFIALIIFCAPIFIKGNEWLGTILAFSYTNVLRVQFLFDDFKTVNVFGNPVLYPIFACLLMPMLMTISIWIVLQIIKRKEITT